MMVRIHNPIKSGSKGTSGTDRQLHGGMMENVDQASNLIANIISIGDDMESNQRNNNKQKQ
jgi:hypothetical protein